MFFWWFMLINGLLIPGIMILFGWLLWKHGPKDINSFYGYRTKRSRKNEESWLFAQEYFGRLWFMLGLILFPVSIIAYIPFIHSNKDKLGVVGLIIMTVQMVIILWPIIPTERQLKKRFSN